MAGQRFPTSTLSRLVGRMLPGLAALAFLLPAPPATAQERTYRLEGYKREALAPAELGKGVVIVVVWASWSPRCREIVERTDRIVERWGDRARVLLVDFQEDAGRVESFLAGRRPRAPVYLDREGSFSKKHAVTNLPALLIFKDGVTGFSGKLPNDPDPLIGQTIG